MSHTTYQHQYHIVWGTKYRRPFIKPYVKKELSTQIEDIVKKYPALHIVSCNSEEDHVHIQIEIPPSILVSKVVQRIKAETSKGLKKRYRYIDKMYMEGSIWSVGYFSSTVGVDEDVVRRYIERQGEEEKPQQAGLGFS